MKWTGLLLLFVVALAGVEYDSALRPSGLTLSAQAPTVQSAASAERRVWYFYTVKWGFQDEFLALFRKNHYPVLQEQVKTGRITSIRTYVPTYHGDGRADWTFAVELTFKDAAAFYDTSGQADIIERLYPDQETFQKEELRRFEILEAHWDVPLNELNLAQ